MCIENITVHKKSLFFIFMNHANMYINAYEAKCDKVSLEKKCWWMVNEMKNGMMIVNIVHPPAQQNWLHFPMQLGIGHGSEKEMEHDGVIFQIIHY